MVGAGTPVPCMTVAHTQGTTNFWCNEKKLVSVEDLWPSMLVHHFVGGYINHDLSYHLPSLFIPPLSDSGTELKNQLMDNVLQKPGIDCILSAPYHSQNNGKLEGFHRYLKPTLKKLCEKEPDNSNQYLNQVLASYYVTPYLATGETHLFLFYGRKSNLPLHQQLKPMQCFLGDPDSGCLNLEMHCLVLSIDKKKLDENRFQNAQKTTDWPAHNFQMGDRVYLKNKQSGKLDLKWRAGYRIVCIEHDGHYLHIENQAMGKTRSCECKRHHT